MLPAEGPLRPPAVLSQQHGIPSDTTVTYLLRTHSAKTISSLQQINPWFLQQHPFTIIPLLLISSNDCSLISHTAPATSCINWQGSDRVCQLSWHQDGVISGFIQAAAHITTYIWQGCVEHCTVSIGVIGTAWNKMHTSHRQKISRARDGHLHKHKEHKTG